MAQLQNFIPVKLYTINPFAAIRFSEVLILFANRSFKKLVQFADGHYSGHCRKPCYLPHDHYSGHKVKIV